MLPELTEHFSAAFDILQCFLYKVHTVWVAMLLIPGRELFQTIHIFGEIFSTPDSMRDLYVNIVTKSKDKDIMLII